MTTAADIPAAFDIIGLNGDDLGRQAVRSSGAVRGGNDANPASRVKALDNPQTPTALMIFASAEAPAEQLARAEGFLLLRWGVYSIQHEGVVNKLLSTQVLCIHRHYRGLISSMLTGACA